MNVYTITLERPTTGERSASIVHRCCTEQQARDYAETLLATLPEARGLRVVEITARR
jgi:hypothetical protein